MLFCKLSIFGQIFIYDCSGILIIIYIIFYINTLGDSTRGSILLLNFASIVYTILVTTLNRFGAFKLAIVEFLSG